MNHNDIKAGDLIQVTATIKVDSVVRNGDGKTLVRYVNADGRNAQVRIGDSDSVSLIDHPLPPLPTEAGSVIEVGGERWFLQEQNGVTPKRWINGYGSFLWPESMSSHAQAKDGFEVLL